MVSNIWQQPPSRNKQRAQIVLTVTENLQLFWADYVLWAQWRACSVQLTLILTLVLNSWIVDLFMKVFCLAIKLFQGFLFSFVWWQVCGILSMLGGKLCLDVVFFERSCALKPCQTNTDTWEEKNHDIQSQVSSFWGMPIYVSVFTTTNIIYHLD